MFFTSLRGGISALAPLLALCAAMLWLTAFGMLGQFVLGGWLFFIACGALGLFALWRSKMRLVRKMLSPGFLLFFAGAVALLFYFAAKQPVFSGWDEFSFWGLAPKMLHASGQMYPLADTGFWYTMTEYPGLVVLGVAGQFFGAFAPWKLYWAYGLLYFACMAALLAAFPRRRWRVWAPLAVCALALPFFFDAPNANATTELSKTWLSAYADLPCGLLFGGALCLYFTLRKNRAGGLWPALLPLAALALIKVNTLPIALVAAGVMAADCLFFGTHAAGFRPAVARSGMAGRAGRRAPRLRLLSTSARVLWPAAVFACVVAPFLAWSQYGQWANLLNPMMRGNQTNRVTVGYGVQQALHEIFNPAARSEVFTRVGEELWNNFLGRMQVDGAWQPGLVKTSMAGSSLATALLILALFCAAVLLARSARQKKRLALAGGLLAGGYAAYHLMLFVVYAYLSQNQQIEDYPRYTSSFTVGWAMLGLLFLGLATTWARPRAALAGRTVLLCLAAAATLRCAVLLRPGYSVLGYPQTAYAAQHATKATVLRFAPYIQPGERAFFVSQGGDGSQYFQWHYYLYGAPHSGVVLDYSITGGDRLAPPPVGEEDNDRSASLEKLRGYLAGDEEFNRAARPCTVILIEHIDADFVQNYGSLFAGLDENAPALYRLGADGLYARVDVPEAAP